MYLDAIDEKPVWMNEQLKAARWTHYGAGLDLYHYNSGFGLRSNNTTGGSPYLMFYNNPLTVRVPPVGYETSITYRSVFTNYPISTEDGSTMIIGFCSYEQFGLVVFRIITQHIGLAYNSYFQIVCPHNYLTHWERMCRMTVLTDPNMTILYSVPLAISFQTVHAVEVNILYAEGGGLASCRISLIVDGSVVVAMSTPFKDIIFRQFMGGLQPFLAVGEASDFNYNGIAYFSLEMM